jgi:hypothetical protein
MARVEGGHGEIVFERCGSDEEIVRAGHLAGGFERGPGGTRRDEYGRCGSFPRWRASNSLSCVKSSRQPVSLATFPSFVPGAIMRLRAVALLLSLLSVSAGVFAQAADLERDRMPVANLAGPWRFHAGDDAAWANADFDDSGWSLLMAGESWSVQGYRGTTGVAWYRLRVAVPPRPGLLALSLPDVEESCQVFANGRLIGQIGDLPPRPRYVVIENSLFPIPADAIVPGKPLELAIRVWHWPGFARGSGGGVTSVPRIGDAGAVGELRQLEIHNTFWYRAEDAIDLYVNILTALAGIGLFLLRRSEREYLLWGLSQFFWSVVVAISLGAHFFAIPYLSGNVVYQAVFALANYLQIEFYVIFLRQRRRWLFRNAVFFLLLASMLNLWGVFAPGANRSFFNSSWCEALMHVCVVGMLWRGTRSGRPGAALLLVTNCLMLSANVLAVIAGSRLFSTRPWAHWIAALLSRPLHWPFPISTFGVLGDLEMFAVLAILVLSYTRSRRDEERLESELEAARAVQKVLIPDEVPRIPGFLVQTVYRPASQVGGDFFQIIPLAAGGALIAVGDVSGKGMPAAMTVSLLVGTFRTLAHYTQSPAEILRAMNQRMLARSQGGFTTCLVLRLDGDGTLTMANAGHIAPYVGGLETAVENGLPLGLSAEGAYSETAIRLKGTQSLTVLTDGVVEARNARGELFGFDRTAAISAEPAEEIARRAQQFGQEDDITVLSLRRGGGDGGGGVSALLAEPS